MSVNPDINPAGWADPDDEDYGDEVRAGRPMPPPPFLPPEATKPYTNLEAAQLEAWKKMHTAINNIALLIELNKAFPTHTLALVEILRLRAELEAKS